MRMLCTQCGHIFDYKDAKIAKRSIYNITTVEEKHCPKCDSYMIEDMQHWRYYDKFLKFAYSGIN